MLKATFQADFTSFYTAVQKAEVSLKSFEEDAKKVGTSLNRMADSLSGKKVIQEATLMSVAIDKIGGTSKLTAAELQRVAVQAAEATAKMKALGMDVPPKIQALAHQLQPLPSTFSKITSAVTSVAGALGLAFGAAAIVAGIKRQISSALEFADTLSNLSAKTSISVVGLQQLGAIGVSSNVSMETLAASVSMLQRKLDDPAAIRAIEQMGLNYKVIRNLKPEDQFIEIAKSVAAIQDPVARANAGAALFGKTWDTISPAITKDMQRIIDQAKVMSSSQVAALDRAGDAWDKWAANAMTRLRALMGEIVIASERFERSAIFQAGLGQVRPRTQVSNLPLPVGLPGQLPFGAGPKPPIDAFSFDDDVLRIIKASTKAIEDRTKHVKIATNAQNQLNQEYRATMNWIGELNMQAAGKAMQALEDRATAERAMLNEINALKRNAIAKDMQADEDYATWYRGLMNEINVKRMEVEGKALVEKVSAFDKGLNTLTQSFTQLAQTSDGAMSKMARGIGTVMASMQLATVAGDEFKTSLANIRGQGDGSKADGYVGLANAALAAAAAIDAATNSTSKTANVLGGAAAGAKAGAAAFGAYGAAAGAAAGAIVGLLKSNASEGKHVSPLRDEFFKMAGSLGKLNEQVLKYSGSLNLVKAIFDAKTVQEYNAAIHDLNRLFEFQTAAMNTLDETVKKYNLTIEEMGPAFQRQELDKKAIELFQDYEVLTKAGADHVVVLGKMAESVNKYIQDAVQMGVEVPAAMRPMLEKMIEQGLLTDAAGTKIGSLEEAGISFAMTMSEGFKSLITEVQKLTDAIARGLGLAIQNIPDADFTISGHVKTPDMHDVPGFAGGTHGRYLDFGRGTPVTLHGRERVMTEDEGRAVAADPDALRNEVAGLRSDLRGQRLRLPRDLARAMVYALQTRGRAA